MHYDCLIVDDEINISKNTSEYFNMFGLKTDYAVSFEDAKTFLANQTVDLVLLDINLKDRTGFELCQLIRQSLDIPIFFISARTSDDDVLTALNIGGDDYIKKPFSLNILLAKVKAMLKRYEGIHAMQSQMQEEKMKLAGTNRENANFSEVCVDDSNLVGNHQPGSLRTENHQPGSQRSGSHQPGIEVVDDRIELDHNYHQLKVAGVPKRLKEMEYQLLKYLVDHKNQVITKDELFDKVWNNLFLQEGTLSVHIRHLREKIEESPNEPTYIKTVWGIGYVFELQEKAYEEENH